MRATPRFVLPFVAAMAATVPAFAATNLVLNGSFEQTSMTTPQEMNTTNVSNWSTTGYNFIFFPGTADTTGSYTPQYNSNITLWGPPLLSGGNGGAASNTMPASSPDGGNFVGADGAFEVGAISQTLSNLVVGTDYTLTFYWAAGQQYNFDGATTENWAVTFGTQTQSTPTVATPSHGFTPWSLATMTFRATTAQQTLSFLAAGTPNGQPPFSLLDGVSLVAAPEPATWVVMLAGLGAAGLLTVRRRRQRPA